MPTCTKNLNDGWSCEQFKKTTALWRVFSTALGALIPVGFLLLSSGLLRQLDDASAQIGFVFIATVVLVLAGFLGAIVYIASMEKRSVGDYFASAFIYLSTVFFGGNSLLEILVQQQR